MDALALLLLSAAALYGAGVARLWRRAGAGRGVTPAQAACFAAGWLALAAALASPLAEVAERLFWAHMVQHEMLMVLAAPLLVLGRPLEAWSWALPRRPLRAAGRFTRRRGFAAAWRALTAPLGAWLAHAAALWLWHAPALFAAALATESLHVAQHASFFGSALLFWWAVLGAPARRGAALALLFTTMLHSGALGALLTFSPTLWYAGYGGDAALSPLEDQQLGGLIMWVPGTAAYLVAGLALAARWLAREARPRAAAGWR
jgi:putative membrane protein